MWLVAAVLGVARLEPSPKHVAQSGLLFSGRPVHGRGRKSSLAPQTGELLIRIDLFISGLLRAFNILMYKTVYQKVLDFFL